MEINTKSFALSQNNRRILSNIIPERVNFWTINLTLLKQYNKYNFMSFDKTVLHLAKTEMSKLMKIKMRSESEIKSDNFKIAVKQFPKKMRIVFQKIDNSVKFWK